MVRVFISIAVLASASPVAAQAPAQELAPAEKLGRELAGQGMLAKLLPMVAAKETEEMVARTPGLTPAEQEALRATARETFDAGMVRVVAAQGRIYAEKLSVADLEALTAFNRSAASERYRAVMPQVIEGTMKSLGDVDFKGETMAAFCKKTGKGCQADK